MPLVDLANVHELFGPGLGGGSGAPFSGALVSKNADQLIANVTPTSLVWQVPRYDVGGWFGTPGDAFFTVPAGVSRVELTAGVKWAAPAGGAFRQVDFRKNGATFPGSTTVFTTLAAGAGDAHGIASPTVVVTEGDVLTVQVFQVSGAGLNVLTDDATFFGIRAIEGFSVTGGPQTFTSLNDTPGTYFGEGGGHLQVNSAETAVEFGQPLRLTDEVTFAGLTTTSGGRNISSATFIADATTLGLGRVELYRCIDTSAPRQLMIRTLDITAGVFNPWIFKVKDQSGGANANNITIVTQAAQTIDGAVSIAITEDYGSVTLYSDGSNLFSI